MGTDMKKTLLFLLKIICIMWGLCFYISSLCVLCVLIFCFKDNLKQLPLNIALIILLFSLGTFLFYIAFKKITFHTNNESTSYTNMEYINENSFPNSNSIHSIESKQNAPAPTTKSTVQDYSIPLEIQTDTPQTSSIQYIETTNSIYRTDTKPVSDEEVPYLIQVGYEQALQRVGKYNCQTLDLSFMQERDKNKKEYTKIPSYEELSMVKPEKSDIYSTDIFFLKYIDGLRLENPTIAQYWYYDYNLNYSKEIKKLISAGLLIISNIYINKLRVEELKNILRHFHLPLTGKKQDLQERIVSNISTSDLSDYLGNEVNYFCATKRGKLLIDNIHESATKNLELEDNCINLIIDYNFETALSLIRNFKASTPNGAGSVPHYNENLYVEIMDDTPFFYTLTKDRDIEQQIRASIVFCRMYGCTQENIIKLLKRIYAENDRIFDDDTKNILKGRLL